MTKVFFNVKVHETQSHVTHVNVQHDMALIKFKQGEIITEAHVKNFKNLIGHMSWLVIKYNFNWHQFLQLGRQLLCKLPQPEHRIDVRFGTCLCCNVIAKLAFIREVMWRNFPVIMGNTIRQQKWIEPIPPLMDQFRHWSFTWLPQSL